MLDNDMAMNDPLVATVVALTAVARERHLTDAGERPFDVADELAEILAAVNARVGGTDELFAGQPATQRTALITSLIADGTERRPGPDRGSHEAVVSWAIGAVTGLARQAVAYIGDDGRSPYPFADEFTDALDSVATRIGGIAELFAGQPITPNMTTIAALLGQQLPDTLPAFRAEPVRVLLDVDDVFDRIGLRDRYHRALQGLSPAIQDDQLPEQTRRRVIAAADAVDAAYSEQKAAYTENYLAAAAQVATNLGLHAPLEVILGHRGDPEAPAADPLTEAVSSELIAVTVVPATGQAPRDHPGRRPTDLVGAEFPTVNPRRAGIEPSPLAARPAAPAEDAHPPTPRPHPRDDPRPDGPRL